MPRVYKKKTGSRSYCNYTQEQLDCAIKAVREDGYSVVRAAEQFGVKRETLRNKLKGKHSLKPGGQESLKPEAELDLKHYLQTCAEWGYPMETLMVRQVVKGFLDKQNIIVSKFVNNLPGVEWVRSFLKRNKLVNKPIRNISNARAEVTREMIDSYFDNLTTTLKDVPAENILNYDETCMHDDPGKKRGVAGKGQKCVERKLNTTKSGITVMFAETATGTLLPPYTVYKSENMWDTWREGGPKGSRFNRSASGWFDKTIFEDWFFQIALPFFKKKEGNKVLIGDNLSAHLSAGVLDSCIANNIKYVFLPANASHLCQPLDVGFYGPLKTAWRKVLMDFKLKNPGRAGLPKECFPKLLTLLLEQMEPNISKCLESGFRKSGIHPLDRMEVYKSLPGIPADSSTQTPFSVLPSTSSLPAINTPGTRPTSNQDSPSCASCSRSVTPTCMASSVVDLLQKMRSNSENKRKRQKKSKVDVVPGKSVLVIEEEAVDDPSVSGLQTVKPSTNSKLKALKTKMTRKRQNKPEVKAPKKKLVRRKLKKEYSSDESVSVEPSESENETNNDFCERLITEIENEKRDEEQFTDVVEGNIKPGVWVLVEGRNKSKKKQWIGQVTSVDENGDPMVKFLKKQDKCEGQKPYFTWCTSDGSVVDIAYVAKVLPEPSFTPRGWLLFPVSFGAEYNIE